jgi:phage tail-like protein
MERTHIARLLPEAYQGAIRADNPLGAVLAAMEALHAPAEARLDTLDAQVDPLRADEPFVFMLADWLGLAGYLDWSGGRPGFGMPSFAAGTGRLRLLVAEAVELGRSRGARSTLERFLTVATGLSGITIEDAIGDAAGRPLPFHLRVTLPAAAGRYADLIGRIVDAERPAHATYEIVFRPQQA